MEYRTWDGVLDGELREYGLKGPSKATRPASSMQADGVSESAQTFLTASYIARHSAIIDITVLHAMGWTSEGFGILSIAEPVSQLPSLATSFYYADHDERL